MKIIDKIKLDRTESCESKSPVVIMLEAVRKIKECGEGIEFLINDYDWLLSLRYILQINDIDLKVEEKGKENDFLRVEVLKNC